jgi:hypothetical protein
MQFAPEQEGEQQRAEGIQNRQSPARQKVAARGRLLAQRDGGQLDLIGWPRRTGREGVPCSQRVDGRGAGMSKPSWVQASRARHANSGSNKNIFIYLRGIWKKSLNAPLVDEERQNQERQNAGDS